MSISSNALILVPFIELHSFNVMSSNVDRNLNQGMHSQYHRSSEMVKIVCISLAVIITNVLITGETWIFQKGLVYPRWKNSVLLP